MDFQKTSKDLFQTLEKSGIKIPEDKKQRIIDKINNVLNYEPTIGIFGKTGVGKSSLCNALFGKEIAKISDVEACTRNVQEIRLNMGQKGLKLLDVPGVGESEERNKEYEHLYRYLLPELDVVLWLLKGDDRAFSEDERFYKNIVKSHLDQKKPFYIVLNQVDKIEPFREWDLKERAPGANQLKNIDKKIENVANFFGLPKLKVIAVSANESYHLMELVDIITYDLPKEKKVGFIKNVEKQNVSSGATESAKKGFIDTVVETINEVVVEIKYRVERKVEEVKDWLSSWWPW